MSGRVVSLADLENDTILALWISVYRQMEQKEVVRSRLVCKAFDANLPSIVTHIKYKTDTITQRSVERLVRTFPNLKELLMEQKYSEESELLDLSGIQLSELRILRLLHCPLKSIKFSQTNTPQLLCLHIEQTGLHAASGFELDLPNLERLNLQFVNVSNSDSVLTP